MRVARRSCRLALALAVVGSTAEAQQRSQDRTPGWIGVSLEVSSDRQGRATRVRITDVNPGSPAEAAGVEAGDLLVSVNDLDRPSELSVISERLRLRAGDPVRMVIERDGRRMELRIRAAARPMDLVAARESRWSLEPDSMVEEMLRAMDSLRTQLVRERAGTIRIRPESGSPRSGVAVVSPGAGATVRAPFEFFVFRGEEHDSLRQEMEVLNRLVSDLDQRLVIRARELERQARSVRRVPLPEDAELELLQREMESAARRSAELRAAMAEAARETAGFGYTARPAPRPDEPDPAQTGPEGFRPLSPYILGRNRVAGAQIIDLVPELAAYFEGVESGVLVVDVAPGTPAAISGLVPGDVVTRMDQVAVRSVEDLRFGVSQAGETLPLTLIRRGTSIQLLLRR